MSFKKEKTEKPPFSQVTISLLSPKRILELSNGEVTKPETRNHRTYKPVDQGLYCEKLFGADKSWECSCGKLKGMKYRYVSCDECGVFVDDRKVRRESMAHIELAVPVVHAWYYKYLPSKIGHLLGIPSKKLENIISYVGYIVIQPGIKETTDEDTLKKLDILTEKQYKEILQTQPKNNQQLSDKDPKKFIAKQGGEAIEMLLKRLDLDTLSASLRHQISNDRSQQRRKNALKRLKIVEAFRGAQKRMEMKPEWMVIRMLPVVSPELRPLLLLDERRFAMSDLTDLYRRVIIRNNRLKRLIQLNAPDIVLRNEKRLVQEIVDAVFDNSKRANAVVSESGRPLKSLSDNLKGKQGRFRYNLLGKRVDYSGRTVIIGNPTLKMHQCGLPKAMAAELFKPFVIRHLIDRGIVRTVKEAKKIIELKKPVIWSILEYVLKDHPVMLNRPPTLHKLSVQAFIPILVEGKAIQIPPLVCSAFNADFDGDQMGVYVPLSQEAIAEANQLMLASRNILNATNGDPIAVPSKDMVLGLYYLTKGKKSTPEAPVKGAGMTFYNIQEVIIAYNNNQVSKHAHIKLRAQILDPKTNNLQTEIIETTIGRALFNEYVPKEVGYINELITSKKIKAIVAEVYEKISQTRVAQFLDDMKDLGFKYCYEGGLTISLDDIRTPAVKEQMIAKAEEEVKIIKEIYLEGVIVETERYHKIINIWIKMNIDLTNILMKELKEDKQGFNSLYMMMDSGARGSKDQIRQMAAMRGNMLIPQRNKQANTRNIIEDPIRANFKEGLGVTDYFTSTHGTRKGLTDTALKVAEAGYTGRKLVELSHSLIIIEENCNVQRGAIVSGFYDNEGIVNSLSEQIQGRVAVHDIKHPITQAILVKEGSLITKKEAIQIEQARIKSVEIRTVSTCETRYGVCIQCYGINLATGKKVQVGEAIGIIAAQSIAEPGTQLTLCTFHTGGVSSNTVEGEIKSTVEGIVQFEDLKSILITNEEGKKVEIVISKIVEMRIIKPITKEELMSYHIPYGAYLRVKEKQKISIGQELCYWDPYNTVILAEISGEVEYKDIEESVTYKNEYDKQTGYSEKIIIDAKDKTKNSSIIINGKEHTHTYNMPIEASLFVEEGEQVHAGKILAKIPKISRRVKDMTGGLPRVIELFEARNPANSAILSAIEGIVTYGRIKRGKREIIIEARDGTQKKYLVPLIKHLLVQEGDYVRSGTFLTDGVTNIADILAIQGPAAVKKYIVDEIQVVYRLQGVKINNKHIEVIVRQMMQKVEVVTSGDTPLMPKQIIDKIAFKEENEALQDKVVITKEGDSPFKVGQLVTENQLIDENERLKNKALEAAQSRYAEPAIAQFKIQGATRASISSDSFLAAASFQETTKVLSSAAIAGKVDFLRGIKENVIVGNLIPAGTGRKKYQNMLVTPKKEYEALVKVRKKFEREQIK